MKASFHHPPRPVLAALGLALLAAATAQDTPADPSVSTIRPVNAPREAEALKAFSYAQRAEFVTKVRAVTGRLDAQITALAKAQKGGVAGGSRAIALEDLQTSRTELDHHISKLDDAAPETWESLRDAVLASLTQTEIAYDKANKS